VLEPLIVTPAGDGGRMLLFGHRRRAAAVEAGLATVPCDVRAEYAGRSAEQIADMLAENLHRRDLTNLEEAAGYEQLSMFDGWTPERIASRVGRPVEHVRAGLAAAKVSDQLRPKADRRPPLPR
jgi:ParB family chromosome partitioning protein